jgi:uroporphyrinogen III methyltransferase/synthase
MRVGVVYLVGAGPGDPGLVTVRGLECLRAADVVLVDHLVNPELLEHARSGAEIITRAARRGGLDQAEINETLIARARAGKIVVRLKGGDPFVFGRGGEEAEALADAGVPFEIVPGVTAAVAAPAYAGIPLTHRGASGAVAFATGHEADRKQGGLVDWDGLARGAGTIVLYMSVTRLGDVVARLLASGRAASEPVAIIERGTWPEQRCIAGTLGDIVARAAEARVVPPALTIVGEVVRARDKIAWFDRRPLHGRRVLLLSTKEEGDCALRLDGAQLTRVAPLVVEPRLYALMPIVDRLPEFRTIAFASAHAVDALWDAVEAQKKDARAFFAARLATVGEATARRLAAHGLGADLIARGPGAAALAAEILAAGFEGPMLIPRAAAGREELVEALAAHGIAVEPVEAYETRADVAALERVVAANRARAFDAVAFTSPRGAQAFLDAAGGPSAIGRALVAAIGPTTRRALIELGVEVHIVPEQADVPSLLDAVRVGLAARAKIE